MIEGASGQLIEIAWRTVHEFLGHWQESPYLWSREIDVQVELCSRLLRQYQSLGLGTIMGNYREVVRGFERRQLWNRVCCEPEVWYTSASGGREYCEPDVVVWADIEDPANPPDEVRGHNWPILWLCELKLDWSDTSDWDREKIGRLLEEGTTKHACGLRLFRKRATSGPGIDWEFVTDQFRVCTAQLPYLTV